MTLLDLPPNFVPITIENGEKPAPTGWHWERLLNLAKLESGHTPSRNREDWWGGNIYWIALPDIRSADGKEIKETAETTNELGLANSSARLLPKGTVVMSRTASVGFVTIMGRPMATSQDFVNWVCGMDLDSWFLAYLLIAAREHILSLASGAIHKTIYMPTVESFRICLPRLDEQRRIVQHLKERLSKAQRASEAVEIQLRELAAERVASVGAILADRRTEERGVGECLSEITKGVGDAWKTLPVYGATREGIELSKEKVGKHPQRYKPVERETVFYNPMRILIGSIAILDDDRTPGITSPDYVVLRGNEGCLHSRFFYDWLRSPFGADFIDSLARGAVRERLLFKRLASGNVPVPPWSAQMRHVELTRKIDRVRTVLERQVINLRALAPALLRAAFSGQL